MICYSLLAIRHCAWDHKSLGSVFMELLPRVWSEVLQDSSPVVRSGKSTDLDRQPGLPLFCGLEILIWPPLISEPWSLDYRTF